MLTGGTAAGAAEWFDCTAILGRHRQAVIMMLTIWNAKAVPQNDAAATAGTVMAHAIGVSNDNVVTVCHSVAIRTLYDLRRFGNHEV
jgi:hypothetical protein